MMRRTYGTMLFLVTAMVIINAHDPVDRLIFDLNSDTKTIVKQLGWDPEIMIYTDSRPVIDNGEYTIYCHGWGESRSVIPIKQQEGLLPGRVIGFNFEDATEDGTLNLCKTSFGQENDTKVFLYLLKRLAETGVERVHFYGYSRGGAVLMNGIKQLLCFKQHKSFFKRLGITELLAATLLELIQASTLVLDCPLLDMRVVTHRKWPRVHRFIDVIVLPICTLCKYVPWRDQAIKSAPLCRKLDLKLLVHFQQNDQIVTNRLDEPFYAAIKGPHTVLVVGNDARGHFHYGETLKPALHSFRKKYGGPYYDDAGAKILVT